MGNMVYDNSDYLREQDFAIGGHCKSGFRRLKGSGSYATSGDTLRPQDIGIGPQSIIQSLELSSSVSESGTYFVRIQKLTTGVWKIWWYVVATGAQVANAVNLSAERIWVRPIWTQ
jgi:hypothetical protein